MCFPVLYRVNDLEKSRMTVHHDRSIEGLHQVQNSWSPYAHLPRSWQSQLRQSWKSLGFNDDVASKLRYEVDMVLLRMRCAFSARRKLQRRELAGMKHLQLHLGCGNALLSGWINMDCYPPSEASGPEILLLDMRRKW